MIEIREIRAVDPRTPWYRQIERPEVRRQNLPAVWPFDPADQSHQIVVDQRVPMRRNQDDQARFALFGDRDAVQQLVLQRREGSALLHLRHIEQQPVALGDLIGRQAFLIGEIVLGQQPQSTRRPHRRREQDLGGGPAATTRWSGQDQRGSRRLEPPLQQAEPFGPDEDRTKVLDLADHRVEPRRLLLKPRGFDQLRDVVVEDRAGVDCRVLQQMTGTGMCRAL
ncbi:hypothetical protein AB0P21_36845 [Kribbella sp. NPDC056861]|uniref:hypothetical protein n=1 Tax=Kribbella sp. NPDC056861 TaxID=3154857 RepID=UPI0034159E1F